jgi:hypothetical protein
MAGEALRERGERSEAVATVSGVGRAGGRTSGQGFLPAISAPAVGKIAAKPEVPLRGRWRSKSQVGVSGILCKQPL